jgi:acylpyruvate hydrolase
MRLLTFQTADGGEPGVLAGEDIVPVTALGAPASSARGLLEKLDAQGLAELGERAAVSDERIPIGEATLLAPIPDPQKIICLGLNYSDHAAETGQEIPTAPMWFAKFANSLIGSGQDIVLPAAHPDYVDYEAELAVVIGRRASLIDEADALSYVAGAMPFNDVSARDLQLQNPLWTSGKAIDTFAPCGPALVTLEEAGDLGSLQLRTRINGKVVQEGSTANLIFGVAKAVAWLSRTITLEPGDIIATGTPAGVGASQGIFLHDGDTVEVEIDGIGAVSNPVRKDQRSRTAAPVNDV